LAGAFFATTFAAGFFAATFLAVAMSLVLFVFRSRRHVLFERNFRSFNGNNSEYDFQMQE